MRKTSAFFAALPSTCLGSLRVRSSFAVRTTPAHRSTPRWMLHADWLGLHYARHRRIHIGVRFAASLQHRKHQSSTRRYAHTVLVVCLCAGFKQPHSLKRSLRTCDECSFWFCFFVHAAEVKKRRVLPSEKRFLQDFTTCIDHDKTFPVPPLVRALHS